MFATVSTLLDNGIRLAAVLCSKALMSGELKNMLEQLNTLSL